MHGAVGEVEGDVGCALGVDGVPGVGCVVGEDLAVDRIVPSPLDPRVGPAVAAAVAAASKPAADGLGD